MEDPIYNSEVGEGREREGGKQGRRGEKKLVIHLKINILYL